MLHLTGFQVGTYLEENPFEFCRRGASEVEAVSVGLQHGQTSHMNHAILCMPTQELRSTKFPTNSKRSSSKAASFCVPSFF